MNNLWDKSYLKSREERIEILDKLNLISDETKEYLLKSKILTNEMADKFIENQISIYGIPYGIATNFLIDNKEYAIPMAIEEPSVIAASCNAAKLIAKNGGFKTSLENRYIIGQISYYDIENKEETVKIIKEMKDELLKLANIAQENLVKLGGGAKDIKVEIKEDFLIIYLYVDCLDAMGANTVNTMLEFIEPHISSKIRAKKLMSIISNYSIESMVKAECLLDIDLELAKKIELAIKFANSDIFRAVTNNKGIFNGIDAIALATGNDWRAIEAGLHAYASKDGSYKSLTTWEIRDSKLYGCIEIPLAIASFGGSINIHELSKISLEILGNPSAKMLARITACVGLAQNFAALKALVSEGIQKGHMKLHAKSFAITLGANDEEVDIIIEKLKNEKHFTIDKVKKILDEIRK